MTLLSRWRLAVPFFSFWFGFALILALAAMLRFWNIGRFPYAVFDEVYYASFAARYVGGTVNFWEAHPPTGKLIYALVGKFAGAQPNREFGITDDTQYFGDFPYAPLRAAAATAGVLLVAILMLLGRELSRSPAVGLLAGFLAAIDNSLVIESRYILLNIHLLSFGALGLFCFLRKDRAPRGKTAWYIWLTAAGMFLGLAGSVKLTGFVFLAVAWFLSGIRRETDRALLPRQFLLFLVAVPLAVFLATVFIHFALFPAQGPVYGFLGPSVAEPIQDARDKVATFIPGTAFDALGTRISEGFMATLLTLAIHMAPLGHHPAGSPWYSWPAMWRGIPMNAETSNGIYEHVVWLGNPAIWWGGVLALIAAIFMRARGKLSAAADPALFGYLLNLLALSVSPRELFVYLYLPSLLFLVLVLALILERLFAARPMLAASFLLLALAGFIFLMPLTYGLPLNESGLLLREWLPGWRTL